MTMLHLCVSRYGGVSLFKGTLLDSCKVKPKGTHPFWGVPRFVRRRTHGAYIFFWRDVQLGMTEVQGREENLEFFGEVRNQVLAPANFRASRFAA